MSMYDCAVCGEKRCEHVINEACECEEIKTKLNQAYDEIRDLKILNGDLRLLLSDAGVDHDY